MRNIYLAAATLWTIAMVVSCLVSMNNFKAVPLEGGYTDKYVHFTFYFVFTVLWFLYFKTVAVATKQLRSIRLMVFASAVVLGIIIEICQGVFTIDRSADITDVIANTSGSAFGVLVLWLLSKRNK